MLGSLPRYLRVGRRLMCGSGIYLEYVGGDGFVKTRSLALFPLLYTVIYRQWGCDSIVSFTG